MSDLQYIEKFMPKIAYYNKYEKQRNQIYIIYDRTCLWS